MPHAKILPYHALKTLTQLHAELAGKALSQFAGDQAATAGDIPS